MFSKAKLHMPLLINESWSNYNRNNKDNSSMINVQLRESTCTNNSIVDHKKHNVEHHLLNISLIIFTTPRMVM